MKINVLLVLVAAFIGVSASAYYDGRDLPGGCGDTAQGCWSDARGDACIPDSPGCYFDYEASIQTVSLRNHGNPQQRAATNGGGNGEQTLAELIKGARDGSAAVPAWLATRVAKKLCRTTGAHSVTFQVTADLPSASIATSVSYICSQL